MRVHFRPMTGRSETTAGYRMPAEWSPHQATWFSWPHNADTWTDYLPAVERILAEAVAALATGEVVRINVRDSGHGYHVQKLLAGKVPPDKVLFHQFPTNDAWCRDHGAIFVTRDAGQPPTLRALDFQYNAWGGKYPPFDLDNAIPRRMATALGVPCETIPLILEGGSIEVNGRGTLLTTEQCLLNPNRNPTMSREQIEAQLRALLGVTQIIWLGDGIVGDDTDGHIDDLTRFVAEDLVVTAVEQDPADPNYAPLKENRDRLAGMQAARRPAPAGARAAHAGAPVQGQDPAARPATPTSTSGTGWCCCPPSIARRTRRRQPSWPAVSPDDAS